MTKVTQTTNNYESNPFKVNFKGLDLLFKYNQAWAIIVLVVGLFGVVGRSANTFRVVHSTPIGPPVAHMDTSVPTIIFPLLIVISLIIMLAVSTLFSGISSFVAYKTSRQETVGFNDTFTTIFRKFPTLITIQFIVFFKVLGGLILFIIPGLRAGLRYQFAFWPVFEENANARTSLKLSRALTKNHLIEVLGIAIAAAVIPVIAPLLLIGGQAVAYNQLKAIQADEVAKPKIHWLNYALALLISAFLILVVALAVVAVQDLSEIPPQVPARESASAVFNDVF